MLWEIVGSPIGQLIILAFLNLALRVLLLKPADPPTAAGAAVMAIGIFGLGAFRQMPAPIPNGAQLITLELLLIWLYIAGGLLVSAVKGTFRRHLQDPIGVFAIGTWVAGTAVLVRMLTASFPEWRWLAFVLGAIMVLVWLPYMALVLGRFRTFFATGPTKYKLTGRILLPAVSNQAMLLVALVLFPGQVPPWFSIGIISLGYLLYTTGLVLILYRYVNGPGWRLTDDWDNTNCILHGAMSITGLASVQSSVIPAPIIIGSWVWVLAFFVVVETIEGARAVARVHTYGWRRGLLSYDVSQWARNFTFGMFYTFTVHLHSARLVTDELGVVSFIHEGIIAWGHYIVLFLLLVEFTLFILLNVQLKTSAQPSTAGARTA